MQKLRPLLFLIQFLPITVFLAIARSNGFSSIGWIRAFQAGAVVALAQLGIMAWRKAPWNRLTLGVNLYLVIGAIGCTLDMQIINHLYTRLRETGVFITIAIVGLITTFSTPGAFIEAPNAETSIKYRYSAYLIIGTLGCAVVSYFFGGNLYVRGVAPFLFLIVLRTVLRKQIV